MAKSKPTLVCWLAAVKKYCKAQEVIAKKYKRNDLHAQLWKPVLSHPLFLADALSASDPKKSNCPPRLPLPSHVNS